MARTKGSEIARRQGRQRGGEVETKGSVKGGGRGGGRKRTKTSVFTFPKDHNLYCDKTAKYDEKIKGRKRQATYKAKKQQVEMSKVKRKKK